MSNRVAHLLHRVGQIADDAFARKAGETGVSLTPRQVVVLQALKDQAHKPSQTRLVEQTKIDRSTLADIIRRLVQKGERGLLHRRRTKEDARAYAVRLTDEGETALKAALPAAQASEDAILGPLTRPERMAFVAALEKIIAANS